MNGFNVVLSLAQTVKPLNCIGNAGFCLDSIMVNWFSSLLHQNATPIPIHCPLIILPYNAVACLAGSVMK
jgi:hypothetical protein